MAQINIIKDRIRERLSALNLSARSVSLKATKKADAINNILNKDAMPTYERLEAIAKELGCSVTYLTGSSDVPALDPWDVAAGANPVVSRSDMSRDLPIYETSRHAEMKFAPKIAKAAVDFNRVSQFFYRPPYLAAKKRAYGLFVPVGTASPALEIGQAVIVDPARPAGAGDLVVVYLRGDMDDDDLAARPAIFGRLLSQADDHAVVETINPSAKITVPDVELASVHRIVPLGELLGMA